MRGSRGRPSLIRWCVPLSIGLCLGLSACGAGSAAQGRQTLKPLTLETAKSKLLAVQHEIIGMVPAKATVSVFENDTSSLMPCWGEQKKWVGSGNVELRPGLDRTKFLDGVRDSLNGRPGWSATDGKDNDGNRRVELRHDDGTQLLVSFWEGPESLRIGSFSACFEFPEYEYGEKY